MSGKDKTLRCPVCGGTAEHPKNISFCCACEEAFHSLDASGADAFESWWEHHCIKWPTSPHGMWEKQIAFDAWNAKPVALHNLHKFINSCVKCETETADICDKCVQALLAAAFSKAAQPLDDEINWHVGNNDPHTSCADYGCSDLIDFRDHIRALTPADAAAELSRLVAAARLEGAREVISHAPGRLPQAVQDYIAELERAASPKEPNSGD